MQKKKILILYVPLGAGHGAAAKAIEEAIAKKYPETEVKNISILDFAFEIFRAGIPGGFNFITAKIPFVYKLIYHGFNNAGHMAINRTSDAFIKKSHFVEFIKNFNPDFILSTNPLPMQLVSLTKQKHIIDILSANVCTDFGFHSIWHNPDVNYYFVSNEDVKEALEKHGVSSDKIIVSGLPTSLRFQKEVSRQKVFDSLKFSLNSPVLLIVGGKIKYGAVLKIVEKIEEKISAQFIIVAGRDKKLREDLEGSGLYKKPNAKIFGFVDNLEDYMAVSDLILTKAGGLTIAECMEMRLPMVINDFIPGQEEDNVNYLVKNGAGLKVKNTSEAARLITDLLSHPEKLSDMKENCKKLARPKAAEKIIDFIMEKTKI